MNSFSVIVVVSVSALFCAFGLNGEPNQETKMKASNVMKTEEMGFAPVDNMHHFMEYICEPSYKGLKAVLATEPAGRKDWKVFKNHSLVLAETAALVADRPPVPKEGKLSEEKLKQWKQLSFAVYQNGKVLYGSTGDYKAAKENFGLMIDNCNKCHTAFANGKYQLKK